MLRSIWLASVGFAIASSAWTCGAHTLAAELPSSTGTNIVATGITANKPVLRAAEAISPAHPLMAVIQFAEAEKLYLKQYVRSVRCQVTKRERIDGELQEYQFLTMDLQESLRRGDAEARPMRVFLTFQAPSEVAGRKVLFIEGANSGKMLVRKGGKRFGYAVLRIEPDSESARRESLLPITELGFGRLLDRQIAVLEAHARIDPKGENTEVQHIQEAKINGRPCEVVRVRHARPQPGLTFHLANVFVDSELHIPVRIDASDWPAEPGGACPLLAEYTYTNVQLNVDFPEAAFDEARLKQ